MRRKVHYVIKPDHFWSSIAEMARTQDGELLNTLQEGFKYIENESFESTFQGLFSEINLGSDKARQGTTPTATPSSARSSKRSPRAWRILYRQSTLLATPMST